MCPPRAQPLQTPPTVRLKVRLRSAGPLASVNTSTEYSLLRDTLLIIMLVRSLSTPAAKQRALTTRGRSQTDGGPGSGGEPRFRDYEAPAHIRSGIRSLRAATFSLLSTLEALHFTMYKVLCSALGALLSTMHTLALHVATTPRTGAWTGLRRVRVAHARKTHRDRTTRFRWVCSRLMAW